MWSHHPSDFEIYKALKRSPTRYQVLTQIQKDIKRTQPSNPGFRDFHNRKMLQEVLEIYSKYDKELEYIQGMNMITSVILFHVHNP